MKKSLFLFIFFCTTYALANRQEDRYQEALEFSQNNMTEIATELLQENIKSLPLHQKSLELLAKIYWQNAEFIKSIKTYKVLVKYFYDPRNSQFETDFKD